MSHLPVFDGDKHFLADIETVYRHPQSPHGISLRRAGFHLPPLTDVAAVTPLKCRLHRNMWIVDCPTCKNCEFVWLSQPVFLCSYCLNGAYGGKWVRVDVPKNWHEIERVIMARPNPHVRDWLPHETIIDLKRENRARGLPERV